ncbi:hypothetical protein STEG23_020957 [Scotinomys teguina]
MCRLSWFLDPGGWSKAAMVGLYFNFPGICTLSLIVGDKRGAESCKTQFTKKCKIQDNFVHFGMLNTVP